MHGDGQAELARVVELRLINFRLDRAGAELPAPRHAQGEQAVGRPRLPVLRKALDRPLIGRLAVGQSLRPPAGMTRANAGFAERTYVRLGMRLRADVVAPRMHERD